MEQRAKRELLLHCLSMENDEITSSCFEYLSTDDWDEFIVESLRVGVTPILYHLFKTNNIETNIPAGVMLKLEDFILLLNT